MIYTEVYLESTFAVNLDWGKYSSVEKKHYDGAAMRQVSFRLKNHEMDLNRGEKYHKYVCYNINNSNLYIPQERRKQLHRGKIFFSWKIL